MVALGMEKCNYQTLEKLNKLKFFQFKDLFNKSSTKRHNDYDLQAEYTKLIKYTNHLLKENNKAKLKYHYPKNRDFGRLYSDKPSLQTLYNGFRGILQDGITYDIDISSAHPNFMFGLCYKHKIEAGSLSKYITNREECLKDLMDKYDINRGMAKSLFLSALNDVNLKTKIKQQNGRYKNVLKKSFFNKFQNDLTRITKELYNIYKDDYGKYINTTDYNYQGKLINLLLVKMENEYLQKAIKIIQDKNIDISTLMYDGLMIFKNDNYNIGDLLKCLNDEFSKTCDKFPVEITWTYKPHNTELLEELNKINIVDCLEFMGDYVEICEFAYNNLYKDSLIYDGSKYYLLTDEKIITSKEHIEKNIFNEITNHIFIDKDDKDLKILSRASASSIRQLVEGIIKKCPVDNDFIETVYNYTKDKIFFNNGYFDFTNNKFIEGQYNKTFIKINRDFKKSNNKELRKIIKHKILYPIFSINDKKNDNIRYQLYKRFMYVLGRIIGGYTEDKKWYLMESLRDGGKSLISSFLENCFGYYVDVINSGNLLLKSSDDEYKKLHWILDFQFKRLMVSQEITIDGKQQIDGNIIKKISSGLDQIKARKLNDNVGEKKFNIQAQLLICCNDFPEIKSGNDANKTKEQYQLLSKFVDEDFPEKKKIKSYSYYKKDINLINVIKDTDIMNEFINMIFETNKKTVEYPEQLKKDLENDDEEDDYEKLFNLFNFTELENDKINNADLKRLLKKHSIPFTISKVNRLLKAQGAKLYRNSKERGLMGIKYKEDDNNNDYDFEDENEALKLDI